MDLLLTKTPAEDIKNSVLPMVYRALEAPSVQIQVKCRDKLVNKGFMLMSLSKSSFVNDQELCLNIIPTFANLIDYPSMKNALIPRIKSACLQTSSLAVSQTAVTPPKHWYNTINIVFLFCFFFMLCCKGTRQLVGVSWKDFGVPGQVVCPWWDPAFPAADPLQRACCTNGSSR